MCIPLKYTLNSNEWCKWKPWSMGHLEHLQHLFQLFVAFWRKVTPTSSDIVGHTERRCKSPLHLLPARRTMNGH